MTVAVGGLGMIVPKHRLQDGQPPIGFQKMGGEAVAQNVGRDRLFEPDAPCRRPRRTPSVHRNTGCRSGVHSDAHGLN
jgi:hypothetical protein